MSESESTTAGQPDSEANDALKQASVQYLAALLGSTLHLYTGDGRMFAGIFKCTDKDRNIILDKTFEYRLPSQSTVQSAAAATEQTGSSSSSVRVDMTSRYMGLVVVPGQHIVKIEIEER